MHETSSFVHSSGPLPPFFPETSPFLDSWTCCFLLSICRSFFFAFPKALLDAFLPPRDRRIFICNTCAFSLLSLCIVHSATSPFLFQGPPVADVSVSGTPLQPLRRFPSHVNPPSLSYETGSPGDSPPPELGIYFGAVYASSFEISIFSAVCCC